jgi:hypothetical protein
MVEQSDSTAQPISYNIRLAAETDFGEIDIALDSVKDLVAGYGQGYLDLVRRR